MLLKRLIIFLVRKKLGLRKYQVFKFDNQKTDAVYWFADKHIIKALDGKCTDSSVSLNWLLNDECKITPVVYDD